MYSATPSAEPYEVPNNDKAMQKSNPLEAKCLDDYEAASYTSPENVYDEVDQGYYEQSIQQTCTEYSDIELSKEPLSKSMEKCPAYGASFNQNGKF